MRAALPEKPLPLQSSKASLTKIARAMRAVSRKSLPGLPPLPPYMKQTAPLPRLTPRQGCKALHTRPSAPAICRPCRASFSPVSCRASSTGWGLRRGCGLSETLAVKCREIDRIDVKRRKATAADGLGDNLAREGKQQARALDHDDRMHVAWGNVLQPEQARVVKLEFEQDTRAFACRSFE